jgi:lipopolysaccharide/colanic/teichoic acid biosynthesis glycosyltransferase
MVKRLFDVVCAGLALVVTAPLLGLAAAGIKLTDGGPVLFRARRVGYLGRQFTMYKLRTMKNGDGGRGMGDASRITGHRDSRVTPLGNLLRKTKVDELPQLFKKSTSCRSCSTC